MDPVDSNTAHIYKLISIHAGLKPTLLVFTWSGSSILLDGQIPVSRAFIGGETEIMEFDTVKAIVDKKEDYIRRHVILASSVIEKLRQHDVIGEFTAKQLKGNQSNSARQLTILLTTLKTRGLASFQGFLDVLRDTFHGWIVDEILDSKVELPSLQKEPTIILVRDVMNKQCQKETMDKNEQCLQQYGGCLPTDHLHETKYRIPHVVIDGSRIDRPRRVSSDINEGYIDHAYHTYVRPMIESRKDSIHGRHSPVAQIPGSLRDLERIFDVETSSTRKSLAVLKQEELTIKALLQQNLREQQDLLMKQEALNEIKVQMKNIGQSATQLYKPEPDVKDSRSRLRHLQRTYWASNSR